MICFTRCLQLDRQLSPWGKYSTAGLSRHRKGTFSNLKMNNPIEGVKITTNNTTIGALLRKLLFAQVCWEIWLLLCLAYNKQQQTDTNALCLFFKAESEQLLRIVGNTQMPCNIFRQWLLWKHSYTTPWLHRASWSNHGAGSKRL